MSFSSFYMCRGLFSPGKSGFAAAGAHLVDGDSSDDDDADDDGLPVGGDAQQHEGVLQDADDGGAQQGAPDRAFAAGHGHAADDDRRDGVGLIADAQGGVRAGQVAGDDRAAQRAQRTGDHIGQGRRCCLRRPG